MDKITTLVYLGSLFNKAWTDTLALRGVSVTIFVLGIIDIFIFGILVYRFLEKDEAKEEMKKEGLRLIASFIGLIALFIFCLFNASLSIYRDQVQKLSSLPKP